MRLYNVIQKQDSKFNYCLQFSMDSTQPLLKTENALNQTQGKLNILGLVALAVISVDSIRNLPVNAQYGLPVVTFYVIAGLTFFFPLQSAASELAVKFPVTGGSYLWIQAAFGPRFGILSIWLQWVYNMIWYPLIFTFMSSTLGSMINSDLEKNNWFILVGSLVFFWSVSAIAFRGVEAQGVFSVFCTIVGTLLPMAFMIILASFWLLDGRQPAIELSFAGLLPNNGTMQNLAYFNNILFSLLGIEVVAMHAKDVINPETAYPKALRIAGIIIITSLTFSSLALCIIVSPAELSLISGMMEAFSAFFKAYNMSWATYFIGVAIIVGSLGVASSWIISLARGLHVAFTDSNSFAPLLKLNRYGMPYVILFGQGLIYSCLVMIFALFPSVNSSYWLLSTMTGQFSLFYYCILFTAVMKLRKQNGALNWKSAIGPCFAIMTCLVGIIVGYLPPDTVEKKDYFLFELLLVGGELLFLLPAVILAFRRLKSNPQKSDITVTPSSVLY